MTNKSFRIIFTVYILLGVVLVFVFRDSYVQPLSFSGLTLGEKIISSVGWIFFRVLIPILLWPIRVVALLSAIWQ